MQTDQENLRLLLGEPIPPGGVAAETMFSEEEIESFLSKANGHVEQAAYYGWQAKMAQYANLVNVIEGNSSREMGELHKGAKRMVDLYAGFAPTPGRGRARIGRISRPGPS
jgi:hypothetical protein